MAPLSSRSRSTTVAPSTSRAPACWAARTNASSSTRRGSARSGGAERRAAGAGEASDDRAALAVRSRGAVEGADGSQRGEPIEHAERREMADRFGAHVFGARLFSREHGAIDELDGVSCLGKVAGRRTSSRAGANDEHIGLAFGTISRHAPRQCTVRGL